MNLVRRPATAALDDAVLNKLLDKRLRLPFKKLGYIGNLFAALDFDKAAHELDGGSLLLYERAVFCSCSNLSNASACCLGNSRNADPQFSFEFRHAVEHLGLQFVAIRQAIKQASRLGKR
ncbi:hypothetical protein SAMN05216299_13015 [Nitrosospira sp. Nsp14]|uniref:hypothetical protein n=1 Tax=Nitrosospira sp. Nsp14 TaxID=1855333 RepID=UPI0008E3BD34|nr:hypothetical protein [Nitrosospira sp. Nsp14]SFH59891.1 hypothetical protein SAMN05216299_13015 [Nitrosospira sp. Nsp14]